MRRFDDDRDECCGTCRFNRYDRGKQEYYCGNKNNPDTHGSPTAYSERCSDWEEKDR